MSPIHILIADDNDNFCVNLHHALSPHFIVHCCQTGKEVVEQVQALQPDILIMDLLLRELDGISALYQITSLPQPPAVLVITSFLSDYVEQILPEMGVRDLMRKPCDLKAVVSHIRRMASHLIPPISPRAEVIVSRLLTAVNISTHMDGCTQLRAAIPIFARDPSKPLSKEIYAEVAKVSGHDNSRQVERSIRNAIDKAWSSPVGAAQSRYFPQGKPTSKAFISRLAEELNQILLEETKPAAK